MNVSEPTYFLWAVLLGGLSAASLPLGSAIGLVARLKPTVIATLAAFGAGALIAALSVELVAPTVEGLNQSGHSGHSGADRAAAIFGFWALIGGAILGGLLFVLLDQLVSARGGFLRKWSTTMTYFRKRRHEQTMQILQDLCTVPLLRALPPKQVGLLVHDVNVAMFSDEEIVFREGDRGDKLFFLQQGEIEFSQHGQPLTTLIPGQVVGELELLTRTPRTVTAKAKGEVRALFLCCEDFERWRTICPELDQALRDLASQRITELHAYAHQRHAEAEDWAQQAVVALKEGGDIPTPAEIRQVRAEHSGAPLAVWLGILLDGIPESIVIGTGFLSLVSMRLSLSPHINFVDVIPYTLIAGLFLSNFPEAMASSMGMKEQGWGALKILWMWTVLMIVTGVGAGIGYLIGDAVPHTLLVAVEGVAAGAMLTMIASTMIPEAVHLGGGSVVGLSTLIGFLSAISFKLLEV